MSRVFLACALAALVPVAARGEPISVAFGSGSGGLSASGTPSVDYRTINLGQIALPGGSASGTFFFSDAKVWRDYNVNFDVLLGPRVTGFRVELLDPLGDGDDALDQAPDATYVPAGYSTSNNKDGLSFAQESGLERSARFAGGSANMTAIETDHRGDILIFSGLRGAENARVTFGLRDTQGARGFLMFINALGGDTAPVPEPASMLLIGTGLAGLAAARRRRRTAQLAARAAE